MHRRKLIRPMTTLGLLAALSASSGCVFDEGLLIHNLQGTVALPVEAGTRVFVRTNEDGSTYEETVVDAALIGPVYLGLFPSVLPANTLASYPHPEIGPQYAEGVQGDTYPYGGTTVGDLRFACYEFLTCQFTGGRFATYDDLVNWYADVLGTPITAASGAQVDAGVLVQQTCFDLLEVTSDHEVGLVTGDTNDDGVADAKDLDFVLSDDGQFFEASFTIWQQDYYWDVNEESETGCTPGKDCTGFSLWGFMDAPDVISNLFSTCDPTLGFDEQTYNNDFFGGTAQPNVLNQPAQFITDGDWVAGEGYVWKDIFEQPRLVLDHEVQ